MKYHIQIGKSLNIEVTSANYFGARHAIETIFQSFEYDDVRNQFLAMAEYDINDAPEFGHRGISLDTSRNFMTKEVILRLIDGMASTKVTCLRTNTDQTGVTISHSSL